MTAGAAAWAAGRLGTAIARAGAPASPLANDRIGPDPRQFDQVVGRGVDFLKKSQAADGSFSKQAGIGVTALVTTALLRQNLGPGDPTVAKGLKSLESCVQPDGGIYTPGIDYRNYETCLGVLCLTEANTDKRYDPIIRRAERFLKEAQWDEGEKKEPADLFYGGAGYGKHKRPDLSNTSFLIDALKACGNGSDDPAMQKALIFVSRCQNLECEFNTTPFAAKNPDGGFYYTCAAGGESMAEKLPNGGLRSYASMTYAGLKSMLYAGVSPNDPRVKAARAWIARHYDLTTNPGLGRAGLYYYYHVFAKTLDAVGADQFEDARNAKHDWRRELVEELARRQRPGGSWINDDSRWLEGDPNLVTGYALLALSYCRPRPAAQR